MGGGGREKGGRGGWDGGRAEWVVGGKGRLPAEETPSLCLVTSSS